MNELFEKDMEEFDNQKDQMVDELIEEMLDRYGDPELVLKTLTHLSTTWNKAIEKVKSQKEGL